MRYIGNKTRLLDHLDCFMKEKGLIDESFVFCDAFSGTASVSKYFKNNFKEIISNDNLYFSYVLTQATLNPPITPLFSKLGKDPFDYFNSNYDLSYKNGFFYNTYAPEKGARMYFSDKNAMFIDFIRETIEEWKRNDLLSQEEYYYLLASLIDSVSYVANVAGVYGAYLKKWDPRALKRMELRKFDYVISKKKTSKVYNKDILDFISDIEGDVLYLDPPYTKNKYTTQYHILETLAKNDHPEVKGKSGLRNMKEYSTSLSIPYEAEVTLEKIMKKAKFKHIVLSYSSDGIINKEFIEALFKRYGFSETFDVKEIEYNRYKNAKSKYNKTHKEYLFYIQKKDKEKVFYASPLNYIGGKHDIVDFLNYNMPNNINVMYDLFGGGANISVNAKSNKIVYNDINFIVTNFFESIYNCDPAKFLKRVDNKIEKYNLEKKNKESYIKLRTEYNRQPSWNKDYIDLFLLVMFGFQQQLRFNSNYDYNNPVGMASYNDRIKEKFVSFVGEIKEKEIVFCSKDYKEFEDNITSSDFVYVDPPYLITLGSYNDGKRGFKGWSKNDDIELYNFLNRLSDRGVRFMLSNVLKHKDKENKILKKWIKDNNYKTIKYNHKVRGRRDEIIVINY